MPRRVLFAFVLAMAALVSTAAPAAATECVEVHQFKHCLPV